ncbi:MAG: DNA repair protein RecN [Planctomycetota bacterium]
MLHTLHVRNLALIERAELRLADGLTVISGETGGGKSLLITALKLLRGEKANAALIRHGAQELQVDGEFRLDGGERSAAIARFVDEACGGVVDDGLLLVTRIVDRQGKSRVRLGGRPSTLGALRELGAMLVEIHGQGESRALMRPEIQCETLDAFAGTSSVRGQFGEALHKARQLHERTVRQAEGARERRQRLEFLRFQFQAMNDLQLGEGELTSLEQEHQVLSNLDAMRQHLDQALVVLQDGDENMGDQLARALRAVQHAAEIDVRLEDAAEQLAQIEDLLADVCRKVQSGQARLDLDPGRLDAVQTRLDEIYDALKRFGPTEADFRRNLERTKTELQSAEEADADPETLLAALREATDEAAAIGRKLLRARLKAAEPFAQAVVAELKDLGMERTEVRVAMADTFAVERLLEDATEHGPVPVDIEVRVNPGEPFHSLRETASGGELARVVLAIKKTLADQDRVPLLVLDEIDAEIGGRLGLAVGKKLHEVARHHQVVIVTHLAPVAAFAQHHFLVNKEVGGEAGDERTRSQVRQLQRAEVEKELAAMATGDGGDQTALQQARRLVEKARERTQGA